MDRATENQISPEHAAIEEAADVLRQHEREVEKSHDALGVLTKAIQKARGLVEQRSALEREITGLREKRRTLVADSMLDNGDATAIDASEREIKAAEQRLADLVPRAQDAELAIADLEGRYAKAVLPYQRLSAELPRLRYEILKAVAKIALDEYGKRIVHAYEGYLDAVVIARQMNHYMHQAREQANINLEGVVPESPGRFVFPAINLHGYRIENSIGAHGTEIEKASTRLAKRLHEWGIAV